MININAEIQEILKNTDVKSVYMYPDRFVGLPVISYFCSCEKSGFCCDNSELITEGTVQLDLWSESNIECDEIAINVERIMNENGYERVVAEDIPEGTDGIYHKAMRFFKEFISKEEKE